MKKNHFHYLHLTITILLLFATAVLQEVKSNNLNQEAVENSVTSDDGYKSLGKVSVCEKDGSAPSCLIYSAYEDLNNGRIFLCYGDADPDNMDNRFYAQRSDDNRWRYRVLINEEWLYFDL